MSGRIAMAPIKSSWPIIVARLSLCLLVWGAMVPAALAADRNEPKRLLLLHSFGRDFRPWSEYARSIKAEFEQQSSFALDIQEHTLLSARFNSPGPEAPFVDYLRSLYRASPPDLVMSLGAPAARFVQKYREQLFPDTPLVMTAVEQRLVNRGALTQNDVVIPVRNDFTAFFGSILQVLPETRTVAVVIGASPLEKFWLDEVKREAKPFDDRFELIWYADLSFEEILKRASTLPPHTVLFWQLMSVDGVGVAHEGDLALRRLHAVANGPIFSYQEAFFGRETVGGPMHSISESSKATVSAALRIFAGEKPGDIKIEPIGFAAPRYDWREMQRWGISESDLPTGSEVLFRERGLWERYRWQMAMIAAAFLVQAGLISGLLHERRRRRLADVESRQRLAELAHLSRYAAAGEMTTSIAHELNQPLGSILTNAETAELMLKSASPNLDELRAILADIRRDDQRASEVIRRLRSMLKKTPFEIRDIELNNTVRDVIGFVADVAKGRGVVLNYLPATAELRVRGDPIHLQQVVLNLVVNALDAMSEIQTGKREINVTTNVSGAWAEIRVGDTGAGIATDDLKSIFNPFFTTKPQGMGMGLAIARTIVEAHHGTISAANAPSGGTLFKIKLPITRQAFALQQHD